jgi:hypothetical protein
MGGAFAGIHKFAHRSRLLAARLVGRAMVNTDFHHHGMKLTGLMEVADCQVGFDDALHLVVRCG